MPNEFFPHHANLSRAEREDLETSLRDAPATTALCTSTLELGIDIGAVMSVAQIGAPFSVASLRQRLGRSGRRAGMPAAMRLYITERASSHDLHPAEMLRCELVQAIAMVRLLVAGWCETPRCGGLHLSTLVHQILAIIAQHGGTTASRAYTILCRGGPFAVVSPALFARVLRAIGGPESRLIRANGLVLALRAVGLSTSLWHTVVGVERASSEQVKSAIAGLVDEPPSVAACLAAGGDILRRHKYDRFLPKDLLAEGLAGGRLAPDAVRSLARQILKI